MACSASPRSALSAPAAQPRRGDATPGTPLGPSRGIVYKLAALFSLDAFAGGFVVQSLLALWLFERFGLSLSAASLFFFWTSVLSAFSYPVAAGLPGASASSTPWSSPISRRASASSGGLCAQPRPSCSALLLVRAALSQMDVPTRTSYVMAVVTPAERAAAASVTAVPRSLASSISPAFAGVLFGPAFSGCRLILCGMLKIVYDLALLYTFATSSRRRKARHTANAGPAAGRLASGEPAP